MHFVVMGAGRVGVALAVELEARGHSVGVIDQNSEAFDRLPENFEGRTVRGVGFDQDALRQAGIAEAYAFVAVSSGDNSNIIAARVARETFGVPHVVARIYDPQRAEIYERLGISTVATVSWTAEQVLARLNPGTGAPEFIDSSGEIALIGIEPHRSWVGWRLAELASAAAARIAYLTRFGRGILVSDSDLVQDGDVIHLLLGASEAARVTRLLSQSAPMEHS